MENEINTTVPEINIPEVPVNGVEGIEPPASVGVNPRTVGAIGVAAFGLGILADKAVSFFIKRKRAKSEDGEPTRKGFTRLRRHNDEDFEDIPEDDDDGVDDDDAPVEES